MPEHQTAEIEMNQEEFDAWLDRYQQSGRQDVEAKKALEPYRVTNAVIMAAGMSNRFAPLSFEKPKGLLKVKGEVLIEREIRQLQEAGITEITIVVGYMKELFEYLEQDFGVKIKVNEDYHHYNNTSTLMRVLDLLDRTYICSSDNYFTENPFQLYERQAYYAAVYGEGQTNEYCLQTDDSGLITGVIIGGSDSWYMMGHVYFDREFSRKFSDVLRREYQTQQTRVELWENLYMRHIRELPLYIKKYSDGLIYEFDTLEELRRFDETYKTNAGSDILRFVSQKLKCKESDITDILYFEWKPEVQSFFFTAQGKRCLYIKGAEPVLRSQAFQNELPKRIAEGLFAGSLTETHDCRFFVEEICRSCADEKDTVQTLCLISTKTNV